jgi:NitT/TauT family transport system substrate-binding protein
MLHLHQFFIFLFSLTLAVTLPGCDLLPDRPVSIAAQVWPGYEPMFLARNEGWLDKKLVRLIETESATDSFKALAEGRVDGAAMTLDEVLKARSNGLQLSVVMIFDVSAGADMLLARSGIKKIADLKGKRVGFEQGAVGELMLVEALRAGGLDREDVKPVVLTISRQRDAWSRDQVDAVVTYEPVASQLLMQGALKLFDSRQIPNTIVDVLAIRSDLLGRSHSRAVRNIIAAHFKGLDHLNKNPQDAAYRMAPRLGLPADNVLSAFRGVVLPDAANNYRLLSGKSPELLASAGKLSAIMVKSGLIKNDDQLNSLIRADFLPSDFHQN